MSSLAEIQEAIVELSEDERQALSAWLASQNPPTLAPHDESRLLKSLDQAMRDLDAGKGTSLDGARKLIHSWAGR
jgi:hypothetical protein